MQARCLRFGSAELFTDIGVSVAVMSAVLQAVHTFGVLPRLLELGMQSLPAKIRPIFKLQK